MIEVVDTSAWSWSSKYPELRRQLNQQMMQLEVATCHPVRMELLYTAQNEAEFDSTNSELDALVQAPISEDVWSCAFQIFRKLAAMGGKHHRSVGSTDLLIAAAAEIAGVGLLHYDEDFDRIAKITGQPTRWMAPKGTL